jgi:aspartyl-tRNA(Asn)/glutamyl-tRNA(Gln) amidotransferase subunit C
LKITEEEVRYVADLANLRLSAAEIPRMQKEMDAILGYIDKLNELDTSNVEPMAQVLFEAEETITLRQDVEGPTIAGEAAANAPHAGGGFFKVPRVIDR